MTEKYHKCHIGDSVILTLAIAPVPKGRSRSTRRGHHYADPKTKKAENELKAIFTHAKIPMTTGPVYISYTAFYKKPKSNKSKHKMTRPDLDNILKLLMDAGNGILWHDDGQIIGFQALKDFTHGESCQILQIDYLT